MFIKVANGSLIMEKLDGFKSPSIFRSIILFGILPMVILLNLGFSSATENTEAVPSYDSYWTVGNNLTTARNELAVAEINGKIYVMGGEDIAAGGGQKDSVDVYDTEKDQWNVGSVADMPLALDHTSAAVFDRKIYVVGGFVERKVPTAKVFVYDPSENHWQERQPLPSPIGGALNAQFIDDILYVVGGVNASHVPVNTNYAYDPSTDKWTIKAPMPTARHHLQTAVVDGKLFAMGGRILGDGIRSENIPETLSNFDRNEMYDPKTNSWTTREHMLTKRSGFTAETGPDGYIYVFGGEGLQGDLNSVEKYDPISDKWTFEKPMPTKRFGLNSVTSGDKIYVLGGQMRTNPGLLPLSTNEIFHAVNKTQ